MLHQSERAIWNKRLISRILNGSAAAEVALSPHVYSLDALSSLVWANLVRPRSLDFVVSAISESPDFEDDPYELVDHLVKHSVSKLIRDQLVVDDGTVDDSTVDVDTGPERHQVADGAEKCGSIRHVSWNWTNLCNLNCAHCYSRTETYETELSLQESLRVLEQMADLGIFSIHFGGGECLLRKDFPKLAIAASSRGFWTELTTSGWTIDQARARDVAQMGFGRVNVSVDGPTPDDHDRLRRRKGSFERAIGAIRGLRDAGINVNVICMLTKAVLPRVKDMVALCERAGANSVSFKQVKLAGNALAIVDSLPTPDELHNTYLDLISIRQGSNIAVSFGEGGEPLARVAALANDPSAVEEGQEGCSCGTSSICIKPDGAVTPCSYIQVPVGSVRATDLASVIESSAALHELQQMKDRLGRAACKGCSDYSHCRGGCLAQRISTSAEGAVEFMADLNCWKSGFTAIR